MRAWVVGCYFVTQNRWKWYSQGGYSVPSMNQAERFFDYEDARDVRDRIHQVHRYDGVIEEVDA